MAHFSKVCLARLASVDLLNAGLDGPAEAISMTAASDDVQLVQSPRGPCYDGMAKRNDLAASSHVDRLHFDHLGQRLLRGFGPFEVVKSRRRMANN